MKTGGNIHRGLNRFLEAQAGVIDQALSELRAGRKTSHWMWFVFPQLAGLGSSPTSQFYGIKDLTEAEAYLIHPVLGGRLESCVDALLGHRAVALTDIFDYPDNLKFSSSMTLFSYAACAPMIFREALEIFCQGREDPKTLQLLAAKPL